ncbi:hypothetical protein [Actinoalloteichus spitiensis]|uniref:hypothetical protein n=1 Tax=Actinoalloteichus spitiensis TaxID=252394 RepID=UPI000371755D|nr:hypothetical protein [Actinoalloteichus spitiensis]
MIGVIAWPLVIIGLVLSLVGIVRANRGHANNKGLAVAGAVLSVVGLALCVMWVAVVNGAAERIRDLSSSVPVW